MDSITSDLDKRGVRHPVVIALGSRSDISQVFLAVEGHVYPIQRGGLVAAVDRLMKLYFIMNMLYPAECRHVLEFVESVYGISESSLSRSCSDLSLFIRTKIRKQC